jgi:hypothetical protein
MASRKHSDDQPASSLSRGDLQESSTAAYACLETMRVTGPDELPVSPNTCQRDRRGYEDLR